MSVVPSRDEEAYVILSPHFRAVADIVSSYSADGTKLTELSKVKFIVDSKVHDSQRHFAMTAENGRTMWFAPGIVHLALDTMVAIICHEFGHAADFLYPARWVSKPRPGDRARWLDDDLVGTTEAKRWQNQWLNRTRDQVEWAADAIAWELTDNKIEYGGPLELQCLGRCGEPRRAGLR